MGRGEVGGEEERQGNEKAGGQGGGARSGKGRRGRGKEAGGEEEGEVEGKGATSGCGKNERTTGCNHNGEQRQC